MRWLWAAATSVFLLGFGEGKPLGPLSVGAAPVTHTTGAMTSSGCPPGTAPDHGACLRPTEDMRDKGLDCLPWDALGPGVPEVNGDAVDENCDGSLVFDL